MPCPAWLSRDDEVSQRFGTPWWRHLTVKDRRVSRLTKAFVVSSTIPCGPTAVEAPCTRHHRRNPAYPSRESSVVRPARDGHGRTGQSRCDKRG